ncbi:DUF6278 family protein [Streptomyces sp. 549]|uniref:DUF6278 family protein n=1 Tax=Streptomyces sp. 549 TaxID=3049076 RepID=UPI0024C3BE5C|nr:DUF6278 family protein [Streptomyces sp. 549]MDK1472180.1 DUF6278 family protein [Streptomyces sp. 549]
MNIPFLDNWRKRHGPSRGVALHGPGPEDAEGVNQLLSECEALRQQALATGFALDDSPDSLEALDQMVPRWRDDPEALAPLATDAGLYLGTVIVRTVRGAFWEVWPNGRPVIRFASGRQLDVLDVGRAWADSGTPELSQVYAEVSDA